MLKYKNMSLILKGLSVKNFKCFKKEQSLEFGKITLLTGANSSGKSSLLHSILGCIQSGEFPYKFSPNGKYVNMGDFKEIANKHTAKEINLGFSFYETTSENTYNILTTWKNSPVNSLPELIALNLSSTFFNLDIKKSNGYILNYQYYSKKDKDYTPEKSKEMKERLLKNFISRNSFNSKTNSVTQKEINRYKAFVNTIYRNTNIKNLKIKDIDDVLDTVLQKNNANLSWCVDGLLNTLCNAYDNNINAISSFRLHPDRTYLEQSKEELKIGKFGENYLDQIILWERKKDPLYKELQGIMKEISLFHSINLHRIEGGRYEVLVTTKQGGTKNSIIDVGFGISQFLPIIVADLQLLPTSTLFVAEPEIHLHPNVQAGFGDYLVKQVNSKNKNYVIETHSEYLLNRIRLAIVKGELKEEDLKVYYLENTADDVKIHNLIFNKRGNIENAPNEFFDTYMMDVMDIALNV